ncbi:MAG: CBS domain-containing protein [Candidatus Zipacnadales bacterium]
MVARDIMTNEVVTISEDATAREAVELLTSVGHGAVPVVNAAHEVVGVISYQDVIRLALPEYLDDVDLSFLPPSAQFFPRVAAGRALGDVPVKEFMRRGHLPQVSPDEPVAEVARLMLREEARRVVVVDEGKLVGIIARGDVVRAIVSPLIASNSE